MIKGIGVDIVELDKFRKIKNNQNFLDQILTENEKSIISRIHSKEVHIATFFALKEALMKALGTGLFFGFYWHDIELTGEWNIRLSGHLNEIAKKMKVTKVNNSFTHTKNYIAAIVLLED